MDHGSVTDLATAAAAMLTFYQLPPEEQDRQRTVWQQQRENRAARWQWRYDWRLAHPPALAAQYGGDGPGAWKRRCVQCGTEFLAPDYRQR